jgi:DNA-binding beta-propeller fold protein YncE
MRKRTYLGVLAACAVGGALASCGGGHGGGGTVPAAGPDGRGSISFMIRWPSRTRLIPIAANSIKFTISPDPNGAGPQVAVRPNSSITFGDLPAGSYTISAAAFPSNDGSGTVPQAVGSVTATVEAGKTRPVPITLASTITQVEITPAPPTGGFSMFTLDTMQLTATARDASGNVVLVSPGTIQWKSDNAGTVGLAGSAPAGSGNSSITRLVAASAGTAHVTALETESGISSSSVSVTVRQVSGSQRANSIVITNTGTLIAGTDRYEYSRIASFNNMLDCPFNTYPGLVSGCEASTSTINPSPFHDPRGVAVDSTGTVYVADTGGNQILSMPDMQTAPTSVNIGVSLNGPQGMAADLNDNLYVADTGNNRIVRFKGGASVVFTVPSSPLNGPRAVAVTPQGDRIFIADTGNNRIVVLDSAGNLLGAYTGYAVDPDSTLTQFKSPQGVAVRVKTLPSGETQTTLYVCDTGNNRIVALDPDQILPSGTALTLLGTLYVNQPHQVASYGGNVVFTANVTYGHIGVCYNILAADQSTVTHFEYGGPREDCFKGYFTLPESGAWGIFVRPTSQ